MRRWMAAVSVVAMIGCGGGRAPVTPRVVGDCSGLPADEGRHVATLLPGAGGSECVALVEEHVSPIHTEPAVWVRREGRWSFVALRSEEYENAAWQLVAVEGGTVIGVLDNVIEDPGWELYVVASTDGGLTWAERSVIRKPYYYSFLRALEVDGDRAAIEVELFDDLGSGVAMGRYRYRSRDGGRSWGTPAFTPAAKVARGRADR